MIQILRLFIFIFATLFFAGESFAQCTPLNEETCPDPEGNGEICPDSLNPIIVGEAYAQEVTMLAPPSIDTLDFNVDLHHITLISIDGLPEGIDWVTNAENNEFLTEIYYCILFSGTSNAPEGIYPLKIVVDIYALILGEPVNVFQLTDSTSLFMEVKQDPSSIVNYNQSHFISKIWPNPFSTFFNVEVAQSLNSPLQVELFNLMGERVYKQAVNPKAFRNVIPIEGVELPKGLYFIRLTHENKKFSKLVSKI